MISRFYKTVFPAAFSAVFAFVLFQFIAHAAGPISLESYRAVVAQALALVEQANETPVESRAPILAQADTLLAAVQDVVLPSGSSVEVNNSSTLALLNDPTSTDKALERLRSLNSALSLTPTTVNADDLKRLRDILSSPPFITTVQDNLFSEFLKRIQEFLLRLLNQSASGVLDFADIAVLLGLFVIFGVVFYFIRNLRRNIVPEAVIKPPREDGLAVSSSEAFANAQHFAGIGDFRSAVRQLYLAALLSLDERGRLRFDRALTNREVLREPSIAPPLAAALEPITETFDRTWYGFEPISASDFESYRLLVQTLNNS